MRYYYNIHHHPSMNVFVTPSHDTSMVNSPTATITAVGKRLGGKYQTIKVKHQTYEQWERDTLAYAPDYYTMENDYDDNIDLI